MLVEALLSAITEAVFGYLLAQSGLTEKLRAYLDRSPQQIAFRIALARAYTTFAHNYPRWAALLFDEHFLINRATPFLARCLMRDASADSTELAVALADQLGLPEEERQQYISELTPACADFLGWLRAELRARPEFQPLFDSLALDAIADATAETAQAVERLRAELTRSMGEAAKYQVAVEQAQGVAIGDHAKQTSIAGDVYGPVFSGTFYDEVHVEYTPPPEILPPPKPTPLPEAAGFVGREAESAYFEERLTSSHLAVISGMPGVGKTALAIALARRVGDPGRTFWHSFQRDEGVGYVIRKLAGFLFWQGEEGLWRILESARLAGGQPQPVQECLDYLVHAIQGRGYLFCLDDFQFLAAADATRLGQFVRRLFAEDTSFIITSRRTLEIGGSKFEMLSGLSGADTDSMLTGYGLSLPQDLVTKLHTRTEGNAQFLVLAMDALQHAEDQAGFITRLSEADDIERYLLAEVDNSMTEGERAVMSAVALLLGYPGTRDAIEVVLGNGSVRRTLIDLCSRNLLFTGEGEAGKEYWLHSIVQGFYYGFLSRHQRQEMHLRAGAYYEADEVDVLKAARHFEQGGEHERAARLATADVWGLINEGQVQALRLLLGRLTAQELTGEQWVDVCIARGQIYALLGEERLARESYQEALSQAETLSDSPSVHILRAHACRGMGESLELESPEEAVDWLRRGLDELAGDDAREETALYIRLGSAQIAIALYIRFGSAQIATGKYDAALDTLERGLDFLPGNLTQLRANALIDLGQVYCIRGDVGQGIDYYHQALEIYKQLHDYWGMVAAWANLGIEMEIAGNWPEAAAHYQQALAEAERLGSPTEKARARLSSGILSTKMGDYELAGVLLSNCLQLSRDHGLNAFLVDCESSLADLYLRQENWEEAESLLVDAEQLAEEAQLPEIYRGQAEVNLAKGEPEVAREYIEQSLSLARKMEMDLEEGMSLRVLGQVLLMLGQVLLSTDQQEPALVAFERSLVLLADRDPYEAARTKVEWGRHLVSSGEGVEGRRLLHEACATFQELGAQRDLVAVDEILLE